MTTLTFIGAGNMAGSLIGGLLKQGYSSRMMTACDPCDQALHAMQKQFDIHTDSNNMTACLHSDVVILSVKPQVLKTVATDIRPVLKERQQPPLIISIAAGVGCQQIQQWLDQPIAVVRCMPNTPALVRQGASGLYANQQTSAEQKVIAEELLSAVGYTCWFDTEAMLHAVTAISGSGPAYFLLLMEAMIDAGVKQGISKEQATHLTLQTALGAATLAKAGDIPVDELRRRVTSPGGTTEQAIVNFEQAGFHQIVTEAMAACASRSVAIAKEFN